MKSDKVNLYGYRKKFVNLYNYTLINIGHF